MCMQLAQWPRETITLQAAGLDAYNFRLHQLADGSGHFCACAFLMKNLLEPRHEMNPGKVNSGGWPATTMRTWLNDRVFKALPGLWQHIIQAVNIMSTAGDKSTDIVTSTDKLWLPSAKEVGGYVYSPGFSSEANGVINLYTNDPSRVKYIRNGEGGVIGDWVTRSPNLDDSIGFVNITQSGGVIYNMYAPSNICVCFGFCI